MDCPISPGVVSRHGEHQTVAAALGAFEQDRQASLRRGEHASLRRRADAGDLAESQGSQVSVLRVGERGEDRVVLGPLDDPVRAGFDRPADPAGQQVFVVESVVCIRADAVAQEDDQASARFNESRQPAGVFAGDRRDVAQCDDSIAGQVRERKRWARRGDSHGLVGSGGCFLSARRRASRAAGRFPGNRFRFRRPKGRARRRRARPVPADGSRTRCSAGRQTEAHRRP